MWCVNSLNRALFISVSFFTPYSLHTYSSNTSNTVADNVASSPYKLAASMKRSSDSRTFKHFTFPTPLNSLVELHPESACNPGKALGIFSSCPFLTLIRMFFVYF